MHFLDELLALFRYPSGSGRALLAGTLLLRYCAARFASLTPSWRLPVHGSVGNLVAAYSDAGRRAAVDEVGQGVLWVSGSGSGRKRIRLNRKTPAHLAGYMSHSRPRVWKRLRQDGFPVFPCLITLGGVVIRMTGDIILLRSGQELGDSLGLCRPTSPGLHVFN